MSKKKLIAICGPSAAGKDYLARHLCEIYKSNDISYHNIVSCTTRPARVNEIDGVDYHFLTADEFLKAREDDNLLEYTMFRGWHYGTLKSDLQDDVVNIGVFNPDGLRNLQKCVINNEIEIEVLYITAPLLTRLYRSYKRENKFSWEHIRRAFTDAYDFRAMDYTLDWVFHDSWKRLYSPEIDIWLDYYKGSLAAYRNSKSHKLGLLF